MSSYRRCLLPLCVLLCCATLALAQDEEIQTYTTAISLLPQIIVSFVWSLIYLPIYGAAILVTLAYLRLFNGFENEMLTWVGLCWLGGMVINALAYAATGHRPVLAVLLALPLLFGWALFISTRNFADLTVKDALRVALVVALVCAPYFGSTWRVRSQQAPTLDDSRRPALTAPLLVHDARTQPVEWLPEA